MNIHENMNIAGEYTVIDDTGRVICHEKNVVVQNFFTTVLSYLTGTTTAAIGITKFAAGTGTTTPAKTDTALSAQVFEKNISAISASSSVLTVKTVLAPTECNYTVREMGIFAGSTLISRVAVNFTKNSSTQLYVTWTLTIQ